MQKVENDWKKQPDNNNSPLSNEVDPTSMMSLFNVAAANNVSVEQLAMALRVHQQQQQVQRLSPSFQMAAAEPVTAATTTTTTTTTTTPPPPPPTTVVYVPEEPPVTKKTVIRPYKTKYAEAQKVMNAPMEYYPVGYDKNFDDNFVSKVDLPDTSFSCGDQKHFPGLYGDEDLGCMVSTGQHSNILINTAIIGVRVLRGRSIRLFRFDILHNMFYKWVFLSEYLCKNICVVAAKATVFKGFAINICHYCIHLKLLRKL